MFIAFEQMPAHSRLWIYQANRAFNTQEVEEISEILRQFSEEWNSHGNSLRSSFKILHQRFIVIAADENFNHPSGCSIDKSVAVMKEIEKRYEVSLFSRTDIACLKDGQIEVIKFQELKEKIAAGIIKPETTVFDNLVETKSQLENAWQIPASETWIGRFFGN